ncbi:MAG: 3-oxoacyl-[acyl-carrier-protein] reductase [Planctomycetota bacterium]|nr:MAG: 3-oxoacyl-[acyl-carrier-protein] reductase [Planctomycetota bacterium]
MPDDPPQRVALITGASRGIGRAIALSQAALGRRVVLVSRTEGPLTEVRDLITDAGGDASVLPVDISDADAWRDALESVITDLGRLDILVNNAGVTRDGLAMRMTDEDFDTVLRTNLTSAFIACRAAARPMMKHRFGRIINIASTSGVVGNPGQANYAASKAGLIGLTKSLARELGAKGVTANAVAPGFIETGMTANLPGAVRERVRGSMAVPRLGTPEDVAAAVAYVASDEAGFLTGQVLCVDGGLTMC